MTTRKASATASATARATATADPLRGRQQEKQVQRLRQPRGRPQRQIPFGDANKKSKGKAIQIAEGTSTSCFLRRGPLGLANARAEYRPHGPKGMGLGTA